MSRNNTLCIPATWMDQLLDTAGSVVQTTTNKATRIYPSPPPPNIHTPSIGLAEVGLSLGPLF